MMLAAKDIAAALHIRYGNNPGNGPEWFTAEEVRNRAGFDATRTVDFLAINTWPSKGHEIHGIEIKVSVSDWRRELDQPEKAETWAQHCHRWFVAAPAGVIPVAEVPPTWGLIEVTAGKDGAPPRTRIKLQGVKNRTPVPLDMSMIAAILRRDRATPAEVDNAYRRGVADAERTWAWDRKHLDRLRKQWTDLEASVRRLAPGVAVWEGINTESLLVSVAEAMNGPRDIDKVVSQLALSRGALAVLLERMDETIERINAPGRKVA